MMVLTIGIVLLSQLNQTSTVAQIGFVLAIVGLGTGTFISPNNSAIMGAAPRERQGIAAGLLATARSTGMVLGVGIAGAIFTTITTTSGESNSLFTAFSMSLLVSAAFAALGALFAAVKK
jgi:MFS family permease